MSERSRTATCELVKCPLCSGHGELDKVEVVERIESPEFNRTVSNLIDEVTYGSMKARDVNPTQASVKAVATEGTNGDKKFESRVRQYTPDEMLWRRSNKE